jgi:hypothetical protein
MPATTVHADAIIAALKTTVGSTAGIVAKWEAYPLPWPADAKLPMAFFHFADFVQREAGKHFNQTYQVDIFYVINMEVNTSEPEKYCRTQAELIVDAIHGARTLGIDGNYCATVTRYTPENELTVFFRSESQRRLAYQISVQVDVYEDGA